jgi:predicted amidophosphoribosyltransferase
MYENPQDWDLDSNNSKVVWSFMSEMINCPSCDSPIPENSKFCQICGQRITRTRVKNYSESGTQGLEIQGPFRQTEAEETDWYYGDIPWEEEPVPVQPEPLDVETTSPADNTLVCNSCGQLLQKGMKFCSTCGRPVKSSTPAAQASPPHVSTCPGCGAALQPGKKFCGKCGSPVPAVRAPVPPSAPLCPGCGATIAPGKKFCGKCGIPVPAAPVSIPPVTPPAPLCPGCGTEIKPGKKFCGKCGAPVSSIHAAAQPGAAPPLCPGCGTIIIPGKKFCSKCGAKLP